MDYYYQVAGGGWPLAGGWFIPPGTIVNPAGKSPSELSQWEVWTAGLLPPRDAVALDWPTYNAMVSAYQSGVWWVQSRGVLS
jgi:hypothetical protein